MSAKVKIVSTQFFQSMPENVSGLRTAFKRKDFLFRRTKYLTRTQFVIDNRSIPAA